MKFLQKKSEIYVLTTGSQIFGFSLYVLMDIRMSKISLIFLFCCCCLISSAQLSRPFFTHDIRSSAGNELKTTDTEPFVTFTIGEPIVQTIIEVDNIASQGFQQPFFRRIPCPVYIANAFTPQNFDQNNDQFGPVHECTFESSRFIIYNRWGEMVFESFEEHPEWDGMVNGQPAIPGLYPWVLTYRKAKDDGDKVRTMRGAVSLIR